MNTPTNVRYIIQRTEQYDKNAVCIGQRWSLLDNQQGGKIVAQSTFYDGVACVKELLERTI